MKVVKFQLVFSIVMIGLSVFEILTYKISGCIAPWLDTETCGPEAKYYFYAYILMLVFGVGLFINSFKRKKKQENK